MAVFTWLRMLVLLLGVVAADDDEEQDHRRGLLFKKRSFFCTFRKYCVTLRTPNLLFCRLPRKPVRVGVAQGFYRNVLNTWWIWGSQGKSPNLVSASEKVEKDGPFLVPDYKAAPPCLGYPKLRPQLRELTMYLQLAT